MGVGPGPLPEGSSTKPAPTPSRRDATGVTHRLTRDHHQPRRRPAPRTLAGSVFRARVNVASGVTTFHVLPSTDTARVRSSLSATWTSAPLFVGHRTWGPQAIVSVAVPALEGARTGCRSRRRPAVLCRARNASRRSPLDRPPEGSAARSARGGCVGLTGGQVAPRQSRVRVGRQSHQSDTRNMRLATHPASGLSSNLRRDHSCRPILVVYDGGCRVAQPAVGRGAHAFCWADALAINRSARPVIRRLGRRGGRTSTWRRWCQSSAAAPRVPSVSDMTHKAATAAFLIVAAAVMAELLRRAKAAGPIGPAGGPVAGERLLPQPGHR